MNKIKFKIFKVLFFFLIIFSNNLSANYLYLFGGTKNKTDEAFTIYKIDIKNNKIINYDIILISKILDINFYTEYRKCIILSKNKNNYQITDFNFDTNNKIKKVIIPDFKFNKYPHRLCKINNSLFYLLQGIRYHPKGSYNPWDFLTYSINLEKFTANEISNNSWKNMIIEGKNELLNTRVQEPIIFDVKNKKIYTFFEESETKILVNEVKINNYFKNNLLNYYKKNFIKMEDEINFFSYMNCNTKNVIVLTDGYYPINYKNKYIKILILNKITNKIKFLKLNGNKSYLRNYENWLAGIEVQKNSYNGTAFHQKKIIFYNLNTDKLFFYKTKNNSEILFIENNILYFKDKNSIYSAELKENKLKNIKKIVESLDFYNVHWGFLSK